MPYKAAGANLRTEAQLHSFPFIIITISDKLLPKKVWKWSVNCDLLPNATISISAGLLLSNYPLPDDSIQVTKVGYSHGWKQEGGIKC